MTGDALVVLVTAPSTEAARDVARSLVEERLAACVNVVPGVISLYRWQGRLEQAEEVLLVVKTTTTRYPAVERRVRELHPYDVPEVLALPVTSGATAYVEWLKESVTIEGGG